jgi:hypothetical protein
MEKAFSYFSALGRAKKRRGVEVRGLGKEF